MDRLVTEFMSINHQLHCGAKRRDAFLAMLEKVPVKGERILATQNQRNRALKFARENRRLFVTRQTAKGILLYRAS